MTPASSDSLCDDEFNDSDMVRTALLRYIAICIAVRRNFSQVRDVSHAKNASLFAYLVSIVQYRSDSRIFKLLNRKK